MSRPPDPRRPPTGAPPRESVADDRHEGGDPVALGRRRWMEHSVLGLTLGLGPAQAPHAADAAQAAQPADATQAAQPADATQAAQPASGSDTDGALSTALRASHSAQPHAGRVVMLRHALAPGTFDPPNFQLGDCRTQRNLSDEGRQQSRRIGAWFASHGLTPRRVRASPWCRCMETARLAFGDAVQAWAALGSPLGLDAAARASAVAQLRQALLEVVAPGRGFEVWVTHSFVFDALLGQGASVGEGVLLGVTGAGAPRVMAPVAGLIDGGLVR